MGFRKALQSQTRTTVRWSGRNGGGGAAIARLVIREHDEKADIWVPSYMPETQTVGVYLQKNY